MYKEEKVMNQVSNKIRELIEYLNYHTKCYDEGKPEISDMERDIKYYELDKLEKKYNKKIIISTKVDKSVLGGVYVRVGNDVIDGTVKSKLDELKDLMLKRD